MYEKGEGVDKNMETALEWYRRAAEGGDIQAQAFLAAYLEKGSNNAKEENEKRSSTSTREATVEGQQQKDDCEAFAWWLKAARKGDPEAQFHVGRMLAEGKGTECNLKQVRLS